MIVTKRSRLQVRVQNWLFVMLFTAVLGTVGWLTTRHTFEFDWTAGQRNTLTDASRELLAGIDGDVTVTAYVRDTVELRRRIDDLVARYRRHHDAVTLEFVNPDLEPARARDAGVAVEGEVVVGYDGRSERVAEPSERTLSAALQRLTRAGERWVAFVTGHGERSPHGDANHDYGTFGAELARQGIRARTVNPATTAIPDNTALVVVAGPRVELLPGVADALADWVARGGNLLWLGDPGPLHGLEPLAERLGIEFEPGIALDATGRLFGIDDARLVIVAEYSAHPVTRDFSVVTLFPHATAVSTDGVGDEWTVRPLLTTLPHSRLERDDGEVRDGPLDIGVTLTREHDGRVQRVAVLGDGDFAANQYLGNAGNLEFGLNLVNWLLHDDAQINVTLRSAPDLTLALSRNAYYAISIGFLFALPLALVGAGVAVWIRRRRL